MHVTGRIIKLFLNVWIMIAGSGTRGGGRQAGCWVQTAVWRAAVEETL